MPSKRSWDTNIYPYSNLLIIINALQIILAICFQQTTLENGF
jgi:hypothetical protein